MATVLVIDDDTALLAACRVGLRALGHQVRTAATGDAGLSDAAVHPPDVIVLDLGLPDMDGMQVFSQLREWTQTPVIMLSADGSEDRKVEALNGGADDYVTKPFGMRELDARLRVALRHPPPTRPSPSLSSMPGRSRSTCCTTKRSTAVNGLTSRPRSSTFSPTWPATSGRSAPAE